MTTNQPDKIKFCNKNIDKIVDALKDANGRATERTVESADEVGGATTAIERMFNIPKTAMEGIKFDVDLNAQNFPRAYKYRAESTQFVLEFKNGSWYVSSIGRRYTKASGHRFECLNMPEKTKAYIIAQRMVF